MGTDGKSAQRFSVPTNPQKPDLLLVQATIFVPGRLTERFPQGSRIVRGSWQAGDKAGRNKTDSFGAKAPLFATLLTAEFFAAADPQPSFDASKILFSGQRVRGDAWQVWEMNADGSERRQITHCVENCLRAAYLPGQEIVLTVSKRLGEQVFTNLAVVRTDGSNLHEITFGRANFELETVLRDGRVLASASWPLRAEPGTDTSRGLYTLRPDGAGLDSLRCDHDAATVRGDAIELDDGTIVYIKSARSDKDGKTELARIRPAALHESTLAVAASSYHFPAELLPGTLLVSYRHNPLTTPSLYTLRSETGTLGTRITEAGIAAVQAVPLQPHSVPKKFWSILNLDSATGSFISLNSASSADEPGGHLVLPIVRVRVYEMNPETGAERILGEAPVEADGSFFVEVGANRPVRFELLGEKGEVLRGERGWVWARPGEQRGCAGCHSSKAVVPENRWPLTLKRFDTPTRLTKPENLTAQRPVN